MGEVWAATDTVLGRDVAVKILRAAFVDSPVFLQRFRAEARHTAALAHPGIASVFDYGEDLVDGRGVAYLVMELVPGKPLSEVMAERGPLPVETVLLLLAQAAEALHAAHEMGVVHRDVKPGNLLLLDNGTIKVTDFGIARAVNSIPITELGQVVGTAKYMSPEQASGAGATFASDVYALGVVGYEMLTGRPPFTTENPAALAMAHVHQSPEPLPSTVPVGVRAIIEQALAKDPVDRPGDAVTFARELRRLSTVVASSDHGPVTVATGLDDLATPTRVMASHGGGPATEIMPPGADLTGEPGIVFDDEQAAGPNRRRWLVAVAALVGIVLLLLIVSRRSDGSGRDTTTTTTAAASASVVIDPNALIGQPADVATRVLSAAGLSAHVTAVDAPGVPAGVVTGFDPTGPVTPGATITLDVSRGGAAVPTTTVTTEPGNGNGKGKKPPKH
jgi:serine/threonine-protein kinase